MTTTDSNLWGRPFGSRLPLTRQPDGRTSVDATVIRESKNLKGRLLAILLSTGGRRVLANALAKTVKAIENRNYQPRQAQS
jgi:hypothetical protein